MITEGDAAIVRSLLCKTQAIAANLLEDTKDPYKLTTRETKQRLRYIDAYTTTAIRYMIESPKQ